MVLSGNLTAVVSVLNTIIGLPPMYNIHTDRIADCTLILLCLYIDHDIIPIIPITYIILHAITTSLYHWVSMIPCFLNSLVELYNIYIVVQCTVIVT